MKTPRPIKFRAWRTDPAGSWMDNGEFYVGEDGLVYEHARRTYDTPNTEIERMETQLILMQFTGLKDKNGKEVWEGDLYRTYSGLAVYKVMFIGGAFVGGLSEEKCQPLGWNDNEEEQRTSWLEIIGNIYENPELLDASPVDKSS
jgi:uncharacterized phage protein (TIGR01671 family)